MFNGSTIEETYLYDGSFEGLLTIVFDCYLSHKIPSSITSQINYLPNILDHIVVIQTDLEKSDRIFQGIYRNISYDVLYDSYYAFLSDTKGKELAILQYLLNGFVIGPSIHTMLSLSFVFDVQAARKRTLGESHRLKGLLRFINISDNLFYASIHPDHNVIENLGHHFIRRMPNQNFIIHDKNRNIAMLYNQKEYALIDVDTIPLPHLSKEEQYYQKLWKAFFTTISIRERTNPRLQMQYMPKKYWQDLVEYPLS